MPTTSNFGWTTPADTDLVKDGAAAIRTLGNGVDSSFLDLKGGTSGQILAKNSATDLDFVWVANDQGDITAVTAGTGISGGGTSGAVTITNSMATEITAKGDLIVGTGSGTFDNLPAGTNGYTLVADSSVSPTGLKWAAPAGGGKVLQVVQTTSTTEVTSSTNTQITTGLSASITPSLTSSKILIMASSIFKKTSSNAGNRVQVNILRGVTTILTSENVTYDATANEAWSPWAAVYLDSPSTTSSTTYDITFGNGQNVASVSAQAGSSRGSIVLMEIGA